MKTIVPEGYKKTKVGIYPDDWKEIEVSKYVIDKKKFCNNDDISLYSLTIEEGVVPKSQRYERSHLVKDNEDAYKYVEYGDFVYNPMNLRFGALAVHNEQKEVKVSAYYDVFGIKNDKVNLEYLYAYLKSERIMFYYNRMATGSLEEKKRVHYKEFKKFKFPMPSLKEQQKIAQILTTWDEAIAKQEKIIKEKEHLKKGLMQKLLSGEVRFNGFDKDWNIVKLKDIAIRCTTKNSNSSITTVFSNSAVNGIILQNEYFDKDIAQHGNLDGYYIVKSGDFVYNPRISNNAPAGPINRNLYTQTGVVSPLYTVFRAKLNEHTKFLEYFFKSSKWLKYMVSIANYGARHDRMNISSNDFFNMPILMPENIEQQKIAEVLSLADDEINLLKDELEELKLQKKALMQKLLTGQVRVKV